MVAVVYGSVKGNRHKPDLKIRFWCVYIHEQPPCLILSI